MLREKIDGWKAGLTELQVSVINRHYGLDGQEPQTLTTIGKELGVSRESIRQHEQRGLRKMRLASCLGAGL
jgi:DNA-directed RNA polymerase sigma subunit (sigma70/sigma32)